MYHSLQNLLDTNAVLRRDQRGILGFYADHILNLVLHPLRLCAGQIYLIDYRKYIQVMIQGQINIGQRLRLDSLGSIHHQDGPVTGSQTAAHFIVKIHMAGRINQVKDIFVAIFGLIDDAYRLGFNGNTPFPFQIHIIKHLGLHLPAGQKSCLLYNPVRQGGLAMVYMGNNTKIPDSALIYGFHILPPAITLIWGKYIKSYKRCPLSSLRFLPAQNQVQHMSQWLTGVMYFLFRIILGSQLN